MTRLLLPASLVAAIGCGGAVSGDETTNDSAPSLDTGVSDVGDVGESGDDGGACEAAASSLASSFVGATCTVTVRADATTGALHRWSVACGAAKPTPSEADARAAYAPHVGAYTKIDEYTALPPAVDEWLFYRSPGDFGGLGAVSFARGDVVFAADLAWMGPTTVTFPATWRSAAELDAHCAPFTAPSGRLVSADGGPIDAAKAGLALDAVSRSPLPWAVSRAGHAWVNHLTTRLPSGDGTGASDEWLLFMNTGLLD